MTNIISALQAADLVQAEGAHMTAGYAYAVTAELPALRNLAETVRADLSAEKARERANGYAAGREDASGVKTVPAPDSWRGPDSGWMDYADAFAQAQADYDAGRRGMGTNCKAAYLTWTESGGRTVHDSPCRECGGGYWRMATCAAEPYVPHAGTCSQR